MVSRSTRCNWKPVTRDERGNVDELKPVTWMKEKHRQLKTVGRHKSTGGLSAKRVKRSASITHTQPVVDFERVMVLDFRDGKKGKITWQVRPKTGK